MKDLESALLKVRENPIKYIGETSITRLNLFILGYTLSQSNENESYSDWLREFPDFIQQKYNIKDSVRFTEIIRCFSSSDESAFYKFYELLDEFNNVRSEQDELYERNIKRG